MFFYTAYGLKIESFLALPELQSIESFTGDADIVIKLGRCDLPLEADGKESYFRLDNQLAFCYWHKAGSYVIRDGKEIIVEAASGVAENLLRPMLLGAAMGFLLYQRGIFVLHSSIIAFQNGHGFDHAIGFVGHSHSGKSTMAAAFHKRGHCALSDDLVALRLDFQTPHELQKSSEPLVYPGHLHIKLRSPSVEAFGETTQTLPQWHPDFESYLFQFSERPVTEPLPLRCLYALDVGAEISIERMEAHESLMKLVDNSYCVRSLPTMNTDQNFLQCAQLARQVPLYRLRRPLDFNRLPDVLEAIEQHQKQLMAIQKAHD